MRRIPFVISIFVLFLVFACGKKPESEARVEIIDGVEHVHNTGIPLYPDKSVIFEEELSIGGEGYEMLSRPMQYIVDMQGRIYIADFQDRAIKVFDENGDFVLTIGRQGGGPGEFSNVGRMTFLPDGRLMVTDLSASRISFFDPEGAYLDSHHWTERPGRIHYATNSTCVMTVYAFDESDDPDAGGKLFVKSFDFEGNEIQTFGVFKMAESKTHTVSSTGGSAIVVGIPVPDPPQSIFAADPARLRLYHCVNNEYKIEVFDLDGKIIRRFDRPYEPLPFTGEDAKEYRARYEDSRNEAIKKIVQDMPMPSFKTITPQMRVDEMGNLWVETHEQREEEDKVFTAYDFFNPDGYYEAKVWVDVKPDIFINGKMYLFHTDEETGYRFVKRYSVVWKE